MILQKQEIAELDKDYRRAFINSLAGFRQAVLVGTISKKGITNLAIFNSLIHLGAHPALFGLISRPGSVERHTLQNILDTGVYTLNYIQAKDYRKAHQTSARYRADVSEFEQVGFNELFHDGFQGPFVEESKVKIAMKFEEKIDITVNNTVLLIGSIEMVEISASLIGQDGFVELSKADTVISQGLDAYFIGSELGRVPHATP